MVIITGTLSHFVYEWSGNNFLLGFFFPVNESTWEHMKLCFFPMSFYSIYMNKKLEKEFPCVTSSLLSGILLSTLLVPFLFYTYTGIIGTNFPILDIMTFLLSIILAFTGVYRLTLSCKAEAYTAQLWICLIFLSVCFLVFTYLPPSLGIFKAP